MRPGFEEFGIGCTDMHTWTIAGKQVPVSSTHDLVRQVSQAARATLWRAQTKRRLHLRGPDKHMPRRGCNGGVARRTKKPEGCSNDEHRLGRQRLHTDTGMHSWGGGGGGGAAVKRGLQVVWGCTRRLDALYPRLSTHPSIAKWIPDCLQYIGNVPEGWLQRPGSHEMDAEHLWGLRMQLQAAAK